MSNEWFYIQRWKQRRWEWLGKELPLEEAKRLLHILTSSMDDFNGKPLVIVEEDGKYKVMSEFLDTDNIIVYNEYFAKNETQSVAK